MLEETFPCRLFLGPDKILGPMSTSYVTAVVNPDIRGVIIPVSPILVVYNAGNGITIVRYGGSPNLRIGYPNMLAYHADIGNTLLDRVVNRGTVSALIPSGYVVSDLSNFANQPLVASLADASATYGPILSSALGSGGTGYVANDTFTLPDGAEGCGGIILTVAPITGAVLTYTLTSGAGQFVANSGPFATTTDGAGTGFTLNVLTVLQGNGSLYLEFDYKIKRIPLLASINPSWPVVY